MEKQLEQVIDASIIHWEQIVAWLKKWYAENEDEPDMDMGDVPRNIGWNVTNCSLCQLFNRLPFEANNCRDCPLTKKRDCCKQSMSTFGRFNNEPTIENAEGMIDRLKQLKASK